MSAAVAAYQQAAADAAREVYEDLFAMGRAGVDPLTPARVDRVWRWVTVLNDPADLWDLYELAKRVWEDHPGTRALDHKIRILCQLVFRTYCATRLAEGGYDVGD